MVAFINKTHIVLPAFTDKHFLLVVVCSTEPEQWQQVINNVFLNLLFLSGFFLNLVLVDPVMMTVFTVFHMWCDQCL
jgi:hypothetical protein